MRAESESSFPVVELTDEDLSEVSGGCGGRRGRNGQGRRGNNNAGRNNGNGQRRQQQQRRGNGRR